MQLFAHLRSSFVEDDFNIQNRSKLLKNQKYFSKNAPQAINKEGIGSWNVLRCYPYRYFFAGELDNWNRLSEIASRREQSDRKGIESRDKISQNNWQETANTAPSLRRRGENGMDVLRGSVKRRTFFKAIKH